MEEEFKENTNSRLALCCCRVRTSVRVAVVIEMFVCIFVLVSSLYNVIKGDYFGRFINAGTCMYGGARACRGWARIGESKQSQTSNQ